MVQQLVLPLEQLQQLILQQFLQLYLLFSFKHQLLLLLLQLVNDSYKVWEISLHSGRVIHLQHSESEQPLSTEFIRHSKNSDSSVDSGHSLVSELSIILRKSEEYMGWT